MDQAQLTQLAKDIATKASALGLSIEQHAANEIAKFKADADSNKWGYITMGLIVGIFVGGLLGHFVF